MNHSSLAFIVPFISIIAIVAIVAYLIFISDKIKVNSTSKDMENKNEPIDKYKVVRLYAILAVITIVSSYIISHFLEPIVDKWLNNLIPTPSVTVQKTSIIETPVLIAAREPKPTATPRPTTVGDTFKFGHYEQDNDTSNGKEGIQWEVLDCDKSNNRILVLSVKGLHTMKYHKNNNKTAWGDTSVRKWLNGTFLKSFSSDEKDSIIKTNVSGSNDYCFLLDANQVKKYLKEPYRCKATKQAKAEGAYINSDYKTSSWLLRLDVAENRIAWVGGAGKLYTPNGKNGENYMTSKDNVVRPAMWLKINP